jgi:hypothetical protein
MGETNHTSVNNSTPNHLIWKIPSFVTLSCVWLYNLLFVNPLVTLYLEGPSFNGYGFWGNQEPADVCSAMTNVPAKFWLQNPNECMRTISKRSHSFVVMVRFGLYCLTLFMLVLSIFVRVCIVRPVTRGVAVYVTEGNHHHHSNKPSRPTSKSPLRRRSTIRNSPEGGVSRRSSRTPPRRASPARASPRQSFISSHNTTSQKASEKQQERKVVNLF